MEGNRAQSILINHLIKIIFVFGLYDIAFMKTFSGRICSFIKLAGFLQRGPESRSRAHPEAGYHHRIKMDQDTNLTQYLTIILIFINNLKNLCFKFT